MEEEHLLYALVNQEDSLILKLVEKMNISPELFKDAVTRRWMPESRYRRLRPVYRRIPEQGTDQGFDEARSMGDDYVSVEHLMLSMIDHPNEGLKKLFREFGISRNAFLAALSTVRGNQSVTTDNPEQPMKPLKIRHGSGEEGQRAEARSGYRP